MWVGLGESKSAIVGEKYDNGIMGMFRIVDCLEHLADGIVELIYHGGVNGGIPALAITI